MARGLWLLVLLVGLACGRGAGTSAAHKKDDAGVGDAAAIVLPHLSLGMPSAAAFDYRERAGQTAFVRARDAETRGDWAAVASACREALAADADHLDAAYLLAVALAKTNGTPA